MCFCLENVWEHIPGTGFAVCHSSLGKLRPHEVLALLWEGSGETSHGLAARGWGGRGPMTVLRPSRAEAALEKIKGNIAFWSCFLNAIPRWRPFGERRATSPRRRAAVGGGMVPPPFKHGPSAKPTSKGPGGRFSRAVPGGVRRGGAADRSKAVFSRETIPSGGGRAKPLPRRMNLAQSPWKRWPGPRRRSRVHESR